MKFIDNDLSYAQQKERERRFKLALRMGLPIFAFASLLTFSLLSEYFSKIPQSFLIIAVGILAIMIYFFFYMIYRGFDERITDSVTDTLNRKNILELFSHELKKRENYTVALISIDNINSINEEYGFINGDNILKDVSNYISKFFLDKLYKRVPIGHIKGGDFLVGFDTKKDDVKALIDMLNLKLDSIEVNSIEIYTSSSVVDSNYSNDINHILNRLYELKKNRRIDSVKDEELINPNELETLVIKAIKSRNISIKFQKIENNGENILEASVKLLDDSGNYIHQKEFIGVINRLGMSKDFDMVILELLVNILNRYGDITLSIKFSTISIRHKEFYDRLISLVSDKSDLSKRLIFIISEKDYYRDIKRFNSHLNNYRRLGIKIVLDNFGNDTISLAYFKNLDIDIVRFDGSFTKNITQFNSRNLLFGLITAAEKIGYKSWIKMVENEESYKIAKEMNIDYIQGNFVAKINNIN